jgi:hypothetical protein
MLLLADRPNRLVLASLHHSGRLQQSSFFPLGYISNHFL